MKINQNGSKRQRNYIRTSNKSLVEHLRRDGIRVVRLPRRKRYYESFNNKELPLVDDQQMYLIGLFPKVIDSIREFLQIPDDVELSINHKYKDDDEVVVDEFRKLGYDVESVEIDSMDGYRSLR